MQQRGVFTQSQAIDAGMSQGEARHRVKLGVWQRVAGAGFVLKGQPVDALTKAWALVVSWPAAVIWGPSALAIWEPNAPLPADRRVYGAVRHCHRPNRGLMPKRTELKAAEATGRFGLQVQGFHEALVDTMMMLDNRDKTGLFSWVFTRDKADPVRFIEAVHRRKGRRGVKAMARFVAMAERGVVSEAELLVACFFDQFGIGGWKANVRIALVNQPWRRVDFLFTKERLIVEVDSWEFHSSKKSFQDDRWRDGQLQAAGYRVLRLTWDQVTNQPHATAALVRTLLAA